MTRWPTTQWTANEVAATSPLTREMLEATTAAMLRDSVTRTSLVPRMLFMSHDRYEEFLYESRSVAVWRSAGYERMRGPDGAEWIRSRIQSYERRGEASGSGNRARRRRGFVAIYSGGDSYHWVRREDA